MLPEQGASPSEVFRDLLAGRSAAWDVTLPRAALEALARFLALLDRARRRTNLTGPMTAEELTDHTLECTLAERLIAQDAQVVDIGSGAGFPALPLALVRADLSMSAVEPRRKRADFLRQALREVPVENCRVIQGRARDLPRDGFDVATARAVGGIQRVLGNAMFLRENGLLLLWTTNPGAPTQKLAPVFLPVTTLSVPHSERKAIAVFRKANVPRGTS